MALADINIRVGANIQQLEKSLSKAQRSLNRFSRKMQASGKSMSQNITLPLVAAGGAAVKFAADFETAMVEVQKVTDATTADKLSGSIREMSEEIPMAQTALAGLAADAARFGIRGVDNIENFTRVAAKMAEATDLTAEVAGESLAKIANMAEVPIPKIENMGSAINELSNNFATSSGEIVDAMLRSSAAANSFGLSATQIAGVSAQMNAMSESAERAGTRMRSLFQTLQDPKKIEQIAEALGMTVSQFKSIQQQNPQQALMLLVEAMAKNGQEADNLRGVLERTSRTALAALAQNTDDLTRALGMSEQAFADNTSLQKEFEAASKTFNARLTKTINRLKNVGITIGNMLMPAMNDLIDVITDIAGWFAGLTEKTQKTIIKVLAMVAALGPLKYAIGAAAGQLSSMIKMTKTSAGALKKLVAKFGVAKLAAGGLAIAVGALIAGYIRHNQKVKNFNKAQDEIKSATTEAKKAIVEEKTKVDKLITSIEKETTSRKEKQEALNELQSIAPSYFDSLKVEEGLIENLRKKQEAFNKALLRGAKIEAYKDKLVELNKELIELQEEGFEISTWDKLEGAVKSLGSATGGMMSAVSSAQENYQTKLNNTKEAISSLEQKLTDVSLKDVWTGKQATQMDDAKKQYNEAAQAASGFMSLQSGGRDGEGQQINTMQSEGPDQISQDNTEPGMQLRGFVPTPDQLAGVSEFASKWEQAGGRIQMAVETALQDVAANIGQIIGQMNNGAQGMKQIGGMIFTTLGNLAQKVGKIAIGVAISIEGIKKALQSLNPVAALAAGVALVALGAMVKSQMANLSESTPQLAEGGLTSGPTTAIIGDNPSGREAVIPFERMGEFLDQFQGGNDNQPQELYSHITNRGIFMSNKRGSERKNRMT